MWTILSNPDPRGVFFCGGLFFFPVEGVKTRLQKIWTIYDMIIDFEILLRIYNYMFMNKSKPRFFFKFKGLLIKIVITLKHLIITQRDVYALI
jgi:hypothetical protein